MGGGTSLWAAPEWKTDPKEIFNRKLGLLGVAIAMAGCSYGFDQGNIGGVLTFASFQKAMGFDGLSDSEVDQRSMLPRIRSEQNVFNLLSCSEKC